MSLILPKQEQMSSDAIKKVTIIQERSKILNARFLSAPKQ